MTTKGKRGWPSAHGMWGAESEALGKQVGGRNWGLVGNLVSTKRVRVQAGSGSRGWGGWEPQLWAGWCGSTPGRSALPDGPGKGLPPGDFCLLSGQEPGGGGHPEVSQGGRRPLQPPGLGGTLAHLASCPAEDSGPPGPLGGSLPSRQHALPPDPVPQALLGLDSLLHGSQNPRASWPSSGSSD